MVLEGVRNVRERALLAVGSVVGAVLLGGMVGYGYWLEAGAFVGLSATAVLVLLVVPVRFHALGVLCFLVVVPWQMLSILGANALLFPVLWASGVVLLARVMRRGVESVLDLRVMLGLLAAGWAVLGLALGVGTASLALKWVGLWLGGMALYVACMEPGARVVMIRASSLLGGVLGGYILLEFALRRNLIWGDVVARWVESSFLVVSSFRPTGTMGHPLIAADVMSLLAILQLIALRAGLAGLRRTAVGLTITLAALAATGARGALLVTLICIALILSVSSETLGKRLRYVLAVGVGMAVVWFGLGSLVAARFEQLAGSASMQQRLAGFAAALSVLQSSPLLGMGAGYGGLALRDLGYSVINYETEWAGVIIGMGLPGLLLVFSIPLIGAFSVSPLRWRGPARELAVAAAVFAVGIAGTHNFFEWWGGPFIYWLAISLTVPNQELTSAEEVGE